MKFNEIILGKTKEGIFELITVKYERTTQINKRELYKPAKEAENTLEKYESWKFISSFLPGNPILQAKMQEVFGEYLQ